MVSQMFTNDHCQGTTLAKEAGKSNGNSPRDNIWLTSLLRPLVHYAPRPDYEPDMATFVLDLGVVAHLFPRGLVLSRPLADAIFGSSSKASG